jgi:hypothetical protein
MPMSVILIGLFIIFLNFKIGSRTVAQFPISLYALDVVALLAFLFLCVRPFVLFDRIYVSIGGFIVLSGLAIYLLLHLKQHGLQKK